MKTWLLLSFLLPMMAMANTPSDFVSLGKDNQGDELFVATSNIVYQKMAGLKVDVPPVLNYVIIENFAKPKPTNSSFGQIKSAVHSFFVDCPIDPNKPKPPFQGGMSLAFTQVNAQGNKIGLHKGSKGYAIDDDMVVKSHLLVCDYVAKHDIPTQILGR